ncbi:orotate phosphoribosyltransferase [Helicobacter valdiviensis]|uniref:Orotate phosphoribosyltransferase n=1 Tax=Helicobacter valdiviensis TaxID=1458358 RepID=A0A2W6NG70_9HELI|nr:orotate phosphoribosyltransferase [Helicobacter valdiviensis]PZT47980.1 orotate phosphoribosyltransferase [Helicobacter valdiviensis]
MDIAKIYKDANALLEGHFLLSSGKHSPFYLQSAKVLENPQIAEVLAKELATIIQKSGIQIDCVCSPALGGILAGYELARALKVRFIFTERVNGKMCLRRGFEVKKGEKILVCEDIITTGGSALESAEEVSKLGAQVVAYAALANRGICTRYEGEKGSGEGCKLDSNLPLFALGDFVFETYEADNCPLCKEGSEAYKPGSRGN